MFKCINICLYALSMCIFMSYIEISVPLYFSICMCLYSSVSFGHSDFYLSVSTYLSVYL